MPTPLQFLILTVAGWVNRNQQDVIEYLREENKVLQEKLVDGLNETTVGPVTRRKRMGGVLNYYSRDAA